MLTYQIRGGLGTQVLNLMAAYGDAFDKGEDIEKVVLNFYNYPKGLREVNIDFIFSEKFSSNSKLTKKSIAARYLLTNLLMIGTYCLMIFVFIP